MKIPKSYHSSWHSRTTLFLSFISMQVKAHKLEWSRRMWAEDQKQKYNLGCPHFQRQKSCCTKYWRCDLQPRFFIDCKELCREPLVLQATPFVGRKGLVVLQPSNCCRGMQLLMIVVENRMLTSTKRDLIVLYDNGCDPQRPQIWLVTSSFCCGSNLMVPSLVPRPLPDFISHPCFSPRLRGKIWEWPGDEARWLQHGLRDWCCTTVYLHLSLL